ncbi:MAG: zinc ribbon domain-containing protein [Chitinophagaceae bacterium]|nr:zinc ribbon domain-containing protein [Chitinophagaceae bacterium]
MVSCINCGRKNAEGLKFCTGCGTILISAAKKQESSGTSPVIQEARAVFCRQCGHQNKEQTKFCIQCGFSIAGTVHTAKVATAGAEIPVICNDCGAVLKPSARFCNSCGSDINIQKEKAQRILIPEPIPAPVISVELIPEPGENQVNKTQDTIIKSTADLGVLNEAVAGKEVIEPESATEFLQEPALADEETEREFVPGVPDDEEDPFPKKKKNRRVIIFSVLAILLFSLSAAVYYFDIAGIRSGITGSVNKEATGESITQAPTTESIPVVTDTVTETEPVPVINSNSMSAGEVSMPAKELEPPVSRKEQENEIIPESPRLHTIINDLDNKISCGGKAISRPGNIKSYKVLLKSAIHYDVIISFYSPDESAEYLVTVSYKAKEGKYVYTENSCKVYSRMNESKQAATPVPSTMSHNVKRDLLSYLSGKKIFAGIQYLSVNDITISRITEGVYYKESGNTSYTVELLINNISRKCQVNYTALGKLFVNPIK